MVYEWAVGWLSEGELHLANVQWILRSDFTHGASILRLVAPLVFRRLPAAPASSL